MDTQDNSGAAPASESSPFKPTAPAPETAPVEVSAEASMTPIDEMTPEQRERAELESLRARARAMGMNISGNISLPTLKAKIAERQAQDEQNATRATATAPNPFGAAEPEAAAPAAAAPVVAETSPAQAAGAQSALADSEKPEVLVQRPDETRQQLRARLIAENMRLIRVRITNMDPKKANLPGEVLTVANEFLGSVKKFIPYGEQTDDGFHIPYVLFKLLDKRRFLNIRTRKDPRTGGEIVESTWVKEFAIEVLPQLTGEEIKKLATAQIAAGSVN